MSGLEIAFGIVLLAFAVGIIAIVLLQEGQQKNESVVTGNSSDTFLSKNKSRSIDAFLARWTRVIAIGFFVFVLVINIIMFFTPSKTNAQGGDTSSTASTTSSQAVSGTESVPEVSSSNPSANSAVTSGPASSIAASTPASDVPSAVSTPVDSSAAPSVPAGSAVASNS